jgi:hypothetical protein
MTKRFVRWDTPFTDVRWPSAVVMTGPNGSVPEVEVVVAPSGVDKYPKYIVNFGDVVAFSCMEEMHFPERDFAEAECEEEGLSAYEFLDSAWLESYRKGEYFLFNTDFGNQERLRHYLIVGGDNNIEVITKNTPTFREVEHAKIEARSFVV